MPMTQNEFRYDMRQLAASPEPTDRDGGHSIQDHTEHDGEAGMAMGAILAGMRRLHKRACELVTQWGPPSGEELAAMPRGFTLQETEELEDLDNDSDEPADHADPADSDPPPATP